MDRIVSTEGRDTDKLASRVARAIEDDIVARGWPVGQMVGSEAALMARHGVSRAVLREAIRLVEHHQVATMRRGPSGGLVVRAPAPDPAVNAMVIFLEYCGTTVEDLAQGRLILEPLAAGLAAGKVREDDIAALRAELEREDVDFARHSDHLESVEGLHLAIADLTGNPVLRLFIEVLGRLSTIYAGRPRRTRAEVAAAGRSVHAAHRAIVDAIVSGNAALAERRAAVHQAAVGDWFRAKRAQPLHRRPRPPADEPNGRKLAEVTAWSIRADILGSRYEIGSVVGSEADLLARYGVSRAVLREAIRLLEHHSVARMRRGPGGGLVVTEPDPSASVAAMAIYLEHRKVDLHSVRQARIAIELACVDLVAARSEDPDLREQLTATLLVEADTPGVDLGRLSNELHLRLCELAGNPVLSLFEQLLITVWSRHAQSETSEPLPALATAVMSAHRAIVDALLVGDASLARHRMTRHLEATTDWWQ